jgi:hypothetical protein
MWHVPFSSGTSHVVVTFVGYQYHFGISCPYNLLILSVVNVTGYHIPRTTISVTGYRHHMGMSCRYLVLLSSDINVTGYHIPRTASLIMISINRVTFTMDAPMSFSLLVGSGARGPDVWYLTCTTFTGYYSCCCHFCRVSISLGYVMSIRHITFIGCHYDRVYHIPCTTFSVTGYPQHLGMSSRYLVLLSLGILVSGYQYHLGMSCQYLELLLSTINVTDYRHHLGINVDMYHFHRVLLMLLTRECPLGTRRLVYRARPIKEVENYKDSKMTWSRRRKALIRIRLEPL